MASVRLVRGRRGTGLLKADSSSSSGVNAMASMASTAISNTIAFTSMDPARSTANILSSSNIQLTASNSSDGHSAGNILAVPVNMGPVSSNASAAGQSYNSFGFSQRNWRTFSSCHCLAFGTVRTVNVPQGRSGWLNRYFTSKSPAGASTDEVFDKLLKNIISRFENDKLSVYKALLDLHESHFHFRQEQVDMALSRMGDLNKPLHLTDPSVITMRMLASKERRVAMVPNKDGQLVASNPLFEELADYITKSNDGFDQHEALFLQVGRRTKTLLGSFIWRTNRGQAYGGTRFRNYNTLAGYLSDGLNLSVANGRKAALAGLWVGGGAGIMSRPGPHEQLDDINRRDLFQDYGEFVTSLQGCYVASAERGVTGRDMDWVYFHSRFATCISHSLGGTGYPSQHIARGIVTGIEAALDFLNLGSVQNKKILIHGIGGPAGVVLIKRLISLDVSNIVVIDTDKSAIESTRQQLDSINSVDLRVVQPGDHSALIENFDIIIPNCFERISNAQIVSMIKARIICGTSSNQLFSESDTRLLAQRRILVVPDIIVNRMDLVSCATEQFGHLDNDYAIERHFSLDNDQGIFMATQKILKATSSSLITSSDTEDEATPTPPSPTTPTDSTPTSEANKLGDSLSTQLHPVWPNRSKIIIETLVNDSWHAKPLL